MSRNPIVIFVAVSALLGLAACGDTKGGAAQQTKGDIKEAVGSVTGNDDLKREGQTDQVVGGVKETVQDAKEAVKDAAK